MIIPINNISILWYSTHMWILGFLFQRYELGVTFYFDTIVLIFPGAVSDISKHLSQPIALRSRF